MAGDLGMMGGGATPWAQDLAVLKGFAAQSNSLEVGKGKRAGW